MLRDHDKDAILAVVRHYMSQELRGLIMAEAPAAYNAWCGREVVEVRVRTDNRVIRRRHGS